MLFYSSTLCEFWLSWILRIFIIYCVCVCVCIHTYIERVLSEICPLLLPSPVFILMIAPLGPRVFILLSFDCTVSFSSVGLLYWKAALAAAFPALTETRLIRPSSRAQAFIHYYSRGCVLVAQSYLTLCDPMGCSPPGSSFHGILQTRILGWAVTFLLQGIFRTQRLNLHLLCLLHCR